MSSSPSSVSSLNVLPVTSFQYKQILSYVAEKEHLEPRELPGEPEIRMTEAAFRARLLEERVAATTEVESRLRGEFERKAQQEEQRISKALADFEQSRTQYFVSVEREVVELALSIARKILHRESQVDPLMVSALVQIALGQLKEGAAATLRVDPAGCSRWQKHFAAAGLKLSISVIGDDDLQPGDCILQTEMGTANFGLEAQLKEVEQGFFDVLARRPQP